MAPDILLNRLSGLPGASQVTLGTLLRPTRCPRSFSERFWTILGRFWDPRTMKKHQKALNCLQKTRFSRFLLGACRRSAKSSQNHPRSAPRDPKSDPGGVKSGPGQPQERPGRGPGAARRHLKIGLNALLPPESPKSARERPRSHLKEVLEAILEPPGPHLGAFWEPPGLHF